MILIIDNYDSFVYNLARYVGILGHKKEVIRNDAVTISDIKNMNPSAIILSPGPKGPKDAGICNEVIEQFHMRIPILGICLGHQCLVDVFGGKVFTNNAPMHGRASEILHNDEGLFMGLPNPFEGGRYHSIECTLEGCDDLEKTAWTEDNRLMGVQHKKYPSFGLQFHPESILTDHGLDIMRNFFGMALHWNSKHNREHNRKKVAS